MGSVYYNRAYEAAKGYNKKLLATDPGFNYITKIQMKDGSFFIFYGSFAFEWYDPKYKIDGWLFIFTEHYGFHVYDLDEVDHYIILERADDKKLQLKRKLKLKIAELKHKKRKK